MALRLTADCEDVCASGTHNPHIRADHKITPKAVTFTGLTIIAYSRQTTLHTLSVLFP